MSALKDIYSPTFYHGFSEILSQIIPSFDRQCFVSQMFIEDFAQMELKERMRHTTQVLHRFLPSDFIEAVSLIEKMITQLRQQNEGEENLAYIFLPDYIEVYGLDDFATSMKALELVTQFITCEFAVRPFLLKYGARMIEQMQVWSLHKNHKVRRLASEGSRPHLPWAMAIPALKKDPKPILVILETLKNDPSESVRRSVANNLNDISKDHPELALQIAARWVGKSPETDWIVKHACRGLLKKGNSTALALFGFESGVDNIHVEQLQVPASVPIGGRLDFSFVVRNGGEIQVPVRLEYGIDYITSTGKTSVKVFKIKEFTLTANTAAAIEKYQRFQDFTTRKHFEGSHTLKIIVNGAVLAQEEFEVVPG